MSVWTSNYDIMRDLSKAQGHFVPVDMKSAVGVAVGANEKPPQLAPEEIDEELNDKYACGDFDYSTTPDFSLIQHMLEMVRDDKESSDGSIDGGMIKISKINAPYNKTKINQTEAKLKSEKAITKATEIVIKPAEAKEEQIEAAEVNPASGDGPIKKKRQRNVAVISLLAELESKVNKNNNEPIKLLKPTDFITTKAVNESVRKVDEWFTNKENSVHRNIPSLSSVAMFKKKKEKSEKQVDKEIEIPVSPSKSTGVFKPSSKADEYYQKYLEKSQLKNCIRENIWQKVESLIKETDAKRNAHTPPPVPAVAPRSPELATCTKLDVNWILTEPRHEVNQDADCAVCSAVRKHGYEIEDEIPIKDVPSSSKSFVTVDCEFDERDSTIDVV